MFSDVLLKLCFIVFYVYIYSYILKFSMYFPCVFLRVLLLGVFFAQCSVMFLECPSVRVLNKTG